MTAQLTRLAATYARAEDWQDVLADALELRARLARHGTRAAEHAIDMLDAEIIAYAENEIADAPMHAAADAAGDWADWQRDQDR